MSKPKTPRARLDADRKATPLTALVVADAPAGQCRDVSRQPLVALKDTATGVRTPLAPESRDAFTPTTTFDDGRFQRTAIVVYDSSHPADFADKQGSVDVVRIVDGKVQRLAQINLFHAVNSDGQELLMVDVIDVDKRYPTRRALVFSPTSRAHLDVPEGGNIVASHFARKVTK